MTTAKMLRKVHHHRTIVKNFDLDKVTVFSRAIHGFRLNGEVAFHNIRDRWLEVYEGKIGVYPNPLKINESADIVTNDRLLAYMPRSVVFNSPNRRFLP
jgi:hypothetical protein